MSALALLALATVLSILANKLARFPGDDRLADLVQAFRLPFFDALMLSVTYLGNLIPALVIATLVAGWMWWSGYRIESIFVMLSLSDQIVSAVVKILVQRPRPAPDDWESWLSGPTSSFPSGHVVHFVVFYGFLAYLAHTTVERRWLRVSIYVAAGALMLLVGVSRVYLGVHWPSDVLGGYVIGGLWLLVLIRAYMAARQAIST